MLKHSVLLYFYTCWIHKRGSLTQFLPLKLVEPQSKCKQAHSHCSDGSAVLTFWLIAGFVRSVMRHFFPAQFGKKSFIWRWGSYKADTRALSHTGWLQREWLIPSLASYSMSTVMCWNYWSDKRTRQPWLDWNKKEINGYFTHWTTHKSTHTNTYISHNTEPLSTCCTSSAFMLTDTRILLSKDKSAAGVQLRNEANILVLECALERMKIPIDRSQ